MKTFNTIYITLLYCYNNVYIYIYGGMHILKIRHHIPQERSMSQVVVVVAADQGRHRYYWCRGGGVLFFVAQKLTAEPYHYYNAHYKNTNL